MTIRHPLFVTNGSTGVTSALEARLALAGLLSGAGVLPHGSNLAVTGSSSGPNMKYTVGTGAAAIARGTVATDGLYLLGNDGAVTVDSGAPAPGSGTRWDLIYVLAKNATDFGDSNSDPAFGVLVGVSGSSPTKPYAAGSGAGGTSLPAGAMVLAESSVGTSIANASLASITQVSTWAAAKGGVQLCASSATYPATPYEGKVVYDLALHTELVYGGSGWKIIPPIVDAIGYLIDYNVPTTANTAASGTATWANMGNITVPPWATQAIVTLSINGYSGSAAGAQSLLAVQIGSGTASSGKRAIAPVATERANFAAVFHVTSVATGSQALRVLSTFLSGGTLQASGDPGCIFDARVDYLP